MKVVCFTGASGAGKTRLMAGVIQALKAQGQRVSVVKHAHAGFEIDHEGKDSWSHRQAGAFEVVIASGRRLAKVREFEVEVKLSVHQLLAELVECDWALVEGFKDCDLPRVAFWLPGEPASYEEDPYVVALVLADLAVPLPVPTGRPVFQRDDAAGVVAFLMQSGQRFDYVPEMFFG